MQRGTNKTYTTTKEIDGVTYRAQFNGVREAVRATQKYKHDEEKFDEYLLTNVIVDPPNLTIDDFENLDEFNQVIRFAANVLAGRFRGEEKQGTDKSGSKTESGSVAAGAK